MSLDNIVSVSITRATASVTRAGFGIPLIMSSEADTLAAFTDIMAKTYTNVADMITDLFDDDGVTVAMATALLSQDNKPASFVIGKRTLPPTMIETVDLIGAAEHSTVYSIDINGTTFSITSDTASTIEEIVTALAAAVNGGSQPVTATEDNTTLTLTADTAGVLFTLEINSPSRLKRKNITADSGIVTDVTLVRTDPTGNDNWYCVLMDSQGEPEVKALAAYIETLPRIFLAASGDYAIKTSATDDLASDLQDEDYDRTALFYHPLPHERPDCAWAGVCLPLAPGSETWKFKSLAGVSVYSLTPSERAFVVAKSCNLYERIAGNNITAEGVMASGEFIDNMRFIDFVTARIKEDIYSVLINANKIPYTDQGVAVILGRVQGVLNTGVAQGGFASDPAPTATAPLVADVDSNDRADRLLPDIEFSATLAGAIHRTTIAGIISV
jgi:hypothetical protein